MIYEIRLPVNPVPAARPRVARKSGKVYYPKTYSAFKAAASREAAGACFTAKLLRKLVGPLLVSVVCRVARPKTTILEFPKPDVDNYGKAVLDALNGHAWVDDTQIVGLVVTKEWADHGEPGECLIQVKEMNAYKQLNVNNLLPGDD